MPTDSIERALDGGLRLRLIRPDDEPRLIALYDRLSQHTAYQRFFTAMLITSFTFIAPSFRR